MVRAKGPDSSQAGDANTFIVRFRRWPRLSAEIISAFCLLLSAFSCASTPPPASPAGAVDPALTRAFNRSVEYVGVWRAEDLRPLRPLTVAPDGTVRVVTATKYTVTSPLYGDTWVTVVPETRTICRGWTGDIAMEMRELLGLPPDKPIPNVVEMTVKASDIFRPTPDPSTSTVCPCALAPIGGTCQFPSSEQCGNQFPPGVDPVHVQWIATNTLSVRQLPSGYPWTHLGYTYNWKPGAADIYGASEYVVHKGSIATDIANGGKGVSPEVYCGH